MEKATKICKVCGKEYEYCHTASRIAGAFRWQDVACSPEHGSIYFAKVMESRTNGKPISSEEAHHETHNYENMGDDEYDELFEEVFEDSEDEPAIHK